MQMNRRADKVTKLEAWASAVGVGVADIKGAWQELRRRGLVSVKRDKVVVSPLAMRRAASDAERSLAAHLSGYLLTENSFVVRQAGDPPGLPGILDTRITVEHIANYFREGWGVTEIERDLDLLTRESGIGPARDALPEASVRHHDSTSVFSRRSRATLRCG